MRLCCTFYENALRIPKRKKALCHWPLRVSSHGPSLLFTLLNHSGLQMCQFIPIWGLLPWLFSLPEDPLPTAPTGTGLETGHKAQTPLLNIKGPVTLGKTPTLPGTLAATQDGHMTDVVCVEGVGDTSFRICSSLPQPRTRWRHVHGALGMLNTQPRSSPRDPQPSSPTPLIAPLSPLPQRFPLTNTTTSQPETCPLSPTLVTMHSA